MRVERRGRVARVRSMVNRCCREESGERTEAAGQAVSDRQDGGLGSIWKGQGQQGWRGCRRAVDRGVRAGSARQPVSGLESAVVGKLLSATGQGGGDPQGRRQRAAGARRADGGRPDRPDGGQDVSGAEGRTGLPSRLLRLPAGQVRVGRGRYVPAAVLAGGRGGWVWRTGAFLPRGPPPPPPGGGAPP